MKLVTVLSAAMLSVASVSVYARDASDYSATRFDPWFDHASSGHATGNRNDPVYMGRSVDRGIDPGWLPPLTSGPKGPGEGPFN